MLNCLAGLAVFDPVLFFGRFHILLLHLPIGMLLLLAAFEIAVRFKRFKAMAPARGFIIGLAAVSAAVTATCGWLLATAGGYNAGLLFWHRWLGTGVAVLTLAAWAAWAWRKPAMYYPLMVVAVVGLVIAAHFGGSLSDGSGYLTAYAPAAIRNIFGPSAARPVQFASRRIVIRPRRTVVFTGIIQHMFTEDCIRCHGRHKQKAGLRLDSYAYLMRGSRGRPVIIPRHPGRSILMKRVVLPPDIHHRMPPGRRRGFTRDQLAILRWWIRTGAKPRATVSQLHPTRRISRILKKMAGERAVKPGAASIRRVTPLVKALRKKLGIRLHFITPHSPWIDCNASLTPGFTNVSLAQLAPLSANIRSLNLSGTKITDAGLPVVALMRNLRSLKLNNTAVTDAGMVRLAALHQLRTLNLYGTHVNNLALKPLGNLYNLRHLYVWRTGVTAAAAKQFSAAMVDRGQIRRWQRSIALLQHKLRDARLDVVRGVTATAGPTTGPTKKKL